MKISIITPVYNGSNYIKDKIESVISQTALLDGSVQLQYIVIDGSSVDNTVEIVKSYADDRFVIVSESDEGMYDALAKGLMLVDGDVVGYINAGDLMNREAFSVARDVFKLPNVDWITGIPCFINESNQIIGSRQTFRYKRKLIRSGVYGYSLPFIQQESTFWRKYLNNSISYADLRCYKLAGDAYIWHCFAHFADLYFVDSFLAAFKIHDGQLSANKKKYRDEMLKFGVRRFNRFWLVLLEGFFWISPAFLRKYLSRTSTIYYSVTSSCWNIRI